MAEKLKIGVIGCGAIAQNGHLPFYNNKVKLYAADTSPERLKEVSSSFTIERCYSDYEDMLQNEELDGVSICLPNSLHAKATINAANRGIHILCEKPMALTLNDAKEMNDTCRENSVILMVNFTNRFMDGPRKVKELLEEDVIGEPYSIRVRYVHAGPYNNWAKSDWFYNVGQAGGGALMDMGIHGIDMCHFLMGPIKSVSATLSNLSKDIPVEDNAVAMVEFEKHRVGVIEVGWTGAGGFTGIEVCGSQGSIVLDLRKGLFITKNKSYPDGTVEFSENKVPCEISNGGWETAIVEFISCLENNSSPSCDGELGFAAMKVLLAAYQSAENGQKIVF